MLNRLEMLRLFCAAADAASFKEAAQRLGASPQAITRAVQELEVQVGEVLFHRNTRGNQITEFGEQLAREARASLSRIDSLFQRPSAQARDGMTGVLRIAAPISLGRMFIAPLLRDIGRQHPGIRFDLRLSDQIADVVDEKIDIGVRLGFLRDSRYIAKSVTKLNFHIVGAPELIAARGTPADLEQLAALPTTALIDRGTGRPGRGNWPVARPGRRPNPPSVPTTWRPNATRCWPAWALATWSVTLPCRICAADGWWRCCRRCRRTPGICMSTGRNEARWPPGSGWCSTSWSSCFRTLPAFRQTWPPNVPRLPASALERRHPLQAGIHHRHHRLLQPLALGGGRPADQHLFVTLEILQRHLRLQTVQHTLAIALGLGIHFVGVRRRLGLEALHARTVGGALHVGGVFVFLAAGGKQQ